MSGTSVEASSSPALGSRWRNRKSGSISEVVAIENNLVRLQRGARSSIKYLPHFLKHYAPAQELTDSSEQYARVVRGWERAAYFQLNPGGWDAPYWQGSPA